jgi:membrane-associated phospholipid phosphatase
MRSAVISCAIVFGATSASAQIATDPADGFVVISPEVNPEVNADGDHIAWTWTTDATTNTDPSMAAQVIQTPAGPPPTPAHTGVRAMFRGLLTDFRHLPSRQNLLIAGAGGALAITLHPADDNVNAHLVGRGWAKDVFRPGKIMGQSPTLLGVSAVIYTVGRTTDKPKLSHVGMDLLRSLAVSGIVTQTLKHTARRERPDGSDQFSFPSGHASDTFAFATALERHLGWRGAVPAYLFSSYVAASRLRENRHYLSDVIFGAAVGTIAGRTVTRHGREYYADLQLVPGGAALVWTRHMGPVVSSHAQQSKNPEAAGVDP